MKKLRKMLSGFLAVVMLVGLMPVSASYAATAQKSMTADQFDVSSRSVITIKALDEAGKPVPGALFQVRDNAGVAIEQVTSGPDGVASTKPLPAGHYTVQELFVPDGFVPNLNNKSVSLSGDSGAIVTFTQSRKSVIGIYAIDRSAKPLADVKFVVCNADTGAEVASVVTDSTGLAITGILPPGSYLVKELAAPDGYILATSYQTPVVLEKDRATFVQFPHAKQDALLIETIDMQTRNGIPFAQYSVTNLNGNLVGIYTADDNGNVEVEALKPGDYIVKQTVAPIGYKIDTESQTIKAVSTRILNLRFANQKLAGIDIRSVIQGTHFPLANTTFAIYNETNKEVFRGTTDASGTLQTDVLPAGKYTIKQLNTPDGYTAVETTKIVKVSHNISTTAVFEQKANTSLVIKLVNGQGQPLANARFKVQDINGNVIDSGVTTDAGGVAMLSGLPAGKYMVTQVTAPEGYVLDGNYQWAELKVGVEKTELEFVNNRISGLTIRALDRNTNAPLAGVTFDIYQENGKLVQTVTTDATGVSTVSMLAPGVYLVKEISGPTGYQVDTATQKVTITKEENSTLTFNHVVNANLSMKAISAKNRVPVSGVSIKVNKSNGDYIGQFTTSADGLIQMPAIEPGIYTASVTSVPNGYILDSTPHEIVVKENVQVVETFEIAHISNFTVSVREGQTGAYVSGVELKVTTNCGKLVGNYVTNGAGVINLDLEPGSYIVYEMRVPGGFVLDPQPHNVTINADQNNTLELTVQKESHIRIKVIDADTQRGVYNTEVEILDANNNYIGKYRTDNEGYIILDQVLRSGRYKLRMLSVPDSYILDEVVKTIEVGLNGATDIRWPIASHKGQLTITTLSASDNILMGIYKNSRLSGAVYTITDMSGRLVGTIYSDSYGEAHSGALATGTYYIQQVQAPSGYMVNNQRVTVNISSANQDVKMTIYNKSGNFATSIEAHGPKTVMAGKSGKFFWTNIKNLSSVSVKNFFYHIKVPTDAVRAGTFFTGTYTGTPVTYYIQYKTNYGGMRMLAQGLNSSSQYSYDLSSISLGLSHGEYVTDLWVVFPMAVAGMHESMAPVLNFSVLPNVANGYQIINRAECGCQGAAANASSGSISGSFGTSASIGSIGTGWASSASQGITVVGYGNNQYPVPNFFPNVYPGWYPNLIPDQLPKTGY